MGRALLRYQGKGYYIHFTHIQKLGVNPKKVHTDINGIYCYPVDWFIQNASYSQYAATFEYYYIVRVNKERYEGLSLSHIDEAEAKQLATEYGLEYNEYSNYTRNKSAGANLYHAIRDYIAEHHKNIIPNVNWIEDEGGGIFNRTEPNQICIRNIKCATVIDTGLTKSDNDSIVRSYYAKIITAIGKPNTTLSKRAKNLQIECTYSHQNYVPLKIVISLSVVIVTYAEWKIGHDNLIGIKYNRREYYIGENSSRFGEKMHSIEEIVQTLMTVTKEYYECDALVEQCYAEYGHGWYNERLNKDLNEIVPTDKNPLSKFSFDNDYIRKHVMGIIASKLRYYDYSDELKTIAALSDTNWMEMTLDDYNLLGYYDISMRLKRLYKKCRNEVPYTIFDAYVERCKVAMKQYYTDEQIKQIFAILND